MTLARLEHYTRAAEELMITQPSLSHAISSLEQELGVNLFEKEGRNVVLTKCGKLFLIDVEKSIDILDSGIKTLNIISTGEGRIDIGLLRTLGTDLIPDLAHGFLETKPNKSIDFKFHTGVTGDLIKGLQEKKYDVVFCSKVESERSLEFIPIAKQELVLIVPDDHPLAVKDSVDLIETIPYPQICFTKRSGLRPIIDDLFMKIGSQPTIIYEVEEDQVIAGLVSKNFGIAVVPDMPILNLMKLKVLQIHSPSWERKFYMAVMKNRYLPPVVNDFKQYVMDHSQL